MRPSPLQLHYGYGELTCRWYSEQERRATSRTDAGVVELVNISPPTLAASASVVVNPRRGISERIDSLLDDAAGFSGGEHALGINQVLINEYESGQGIAVSPSDLFVSSFVEMILQADFSRMRMVPPSLRS